MLGTRDEFKSYEELLHFGNFGTQVNNHVNQCIIGAETI